MHLSMQSKHPCIRSNRLGLGETSPEQSLGASTCAETLRSSPSTGDARSSLLLHNHNLGKMRAAYQGRRSHQSLHRASSRRQARSFPTSIGIAPASEEGSLAERPHLEREGARPKLSERIPPSPLLCHELSQLRAEIHDLRIVMQELLTHQMQQDSFKTQLGAEKRANNNQNNNNNNNNNDTDKNNKNTTNNNNNDTGKITRTQPTTTTTTMSKTTTMTTPEPVKS